MASQVEQDACSFKGTYGRNVRQWVNQKTQDPFVVLLSAAFSFVWEAEAQNPGKRSL